ncbi:hypothetical protein [Streptomyces humi]|uniref:hypothetical protein n=1 Tax=Streptomyces humi TaxID=1428620 RepID=UPI001160A125|nr:hypothetical protein [Streptomyces humi]
MPIDFAAVAARFAGVFAAQEHAMRVARRAVRPVLERRLLAGRQTDRATERFPVLLFLDGAVTLRVVPSQHRALERTTPVPSLADAGLAFLTGLTRPRPLEAANALPGLLRQLLAVAAAVDASASGAAPRPAVFDSSDLVGVAVLAFRALTEASAKGGDLERLTAQLRAVLPVPVPVPVPQPTPPAAAAPATAAAPAEALDGVAAGIAAGIAVVVLLPRVASSLLGALGPAVRDAVQQAVRTVLDLRRDALDTAFAHFAALIGTATRAAHSIAGLLGSHLDFTIRFWTAFGTALAAGLHDFAGALGESLRGVVRFLKVLVIAVSNVIDFNLLHLIPWVGDAAVLDRIPLSVGSLLDEPGTATNRALYGSLSNVLDGITKRVRRSPLVLSPYVRRQLRRARRLLDALFDSHGAGHVLLPDFPEGAPLAARPGFPRLVAPELGPALTGAVGALGTGFRTAVRGALTATAAGLGELADGSIAAQRGATRLPGLDGIGERSAELADRVFGEESRRQRAARPAGGIARAFESWLANGGFTVVGAVIDGYVAGLVDRAREPLPATGHLPTSPRILRRAALGRVVMPRLTLRVGSGADLDDDLADAVATAFAGAVQDAYRTGERRLRVLTEGVRV